MTGKTDNDVSIPAGQDVLYMSKRLLHTSDIRCLLEYSAFLHQQHKAVLNVSLFHSNARPPDV